MTVLMTVEIGPTKFVAVGITAATACCVEIIFAFQTKPMGLVTAWPIAQMAATKWTVSMTLMSTYPRLVVPHFQWQLREFIFPKS